MLRRDFFYELPEELIASEPAKERTASRLLCLNAADGRVEVTEDDLRQVAPMALRLRRSKFISDYLENQAIEEEEISENLGKHIDKDDN